MQAISNMYEYLKKNIYKSSKKIYKKIKGVKRKRDVEVDEGDSSQIRFDNYFMDENDNIFLGAADEFPRGTTFNSSCVHNKKINVHENSTVSHGGFGITKLATYKKNGIKYNGISKTIIIHSNEEEQLLMEVKLNIHAMKLVPDSVINLDLILKCNISGRVNKDRKILVLGMEKGIMDLMSWLQYLNGGYEKALSSKTPRRNIDIIEDDYKYIISSAIECCMNFNNAGFFHNDIKPANIVIVERNGVRKCVLIDFGNSDYMNSYTMSTSNQPNLKNFPPIDCYYLLLFIIKYKLWVSDQTRDFIYDLILKIFFIMILVCKFTTEEIEKNINYSYYFSGMTAQIGDFLTYVNNKSNDSLYISTLYKSANDFKNNRNIADIKNNLNNTMISVRTIQDAENEINFLNENPYHHQQPPYNAFLQFNNTNTNIRISNMLKFKKKTFSNNTNTMSVPNIYPYKSIKDIEIQLLLNRPPRAAGHLGRPVSSRPIPSNYVSHFR